MYVLKQQKLKNIFVFFIFKHKFIRFKKNCFGSQIKLQVFHNLKNNLPATAQLGARFKQSLCFILHGIFSVSILSHTCCVLKYVLITSFPNLSYFCFSYLIISNFSSFTIFFLPCGV